MTRTPSRPFAALCNAALLAGCAALQPTAPAPPAAAQRAYAENIELAGRLSVRYQGREKPEALHGSFEWNQSPAQTRVALLSPLGQTIAVIESGADGARLLQANQPPRAAADVNSLTAQTLGWPLPVAGLRDWLQGFGIDQAGRRFTAAPGKEEFTTRDGWLVRYGAWPEDGPPRPKRIDLQRTTAQAGEVAIRIVIDSWQAR